MHQQHLTLQLMRHLAQTHIQLEAVHLPYQQVCPNLYNANGFVHNFSDLTFASETITARGCLIYNDSAAGNNSVASIDFGADKSSSAGNFTISFPTATSGAAIIRIA